MLYVIIPVVYIDPIFPHEYYQKMVEALRQIGERQTNNGSIDRHVEGVSSQLDDGYNNGREHTLLERWAPYNPQIDGKIRRGTNRFGGAGRVTNNVRTMRRGPIQINKTRKGESRPQTIEFRKYSIAIR